MSLFVYLTLITQLAAAQVATESTPVASFGDQGPKASLRPLTDPNHWVGIIGDSGVTGAASSPELTANVFNLLSGLGFMLRDESAAAYLPPGAEALTRVLFSKREELEAERGGDARALMYNGRGSLAVDTPEFSFGYRAARALGVAPGDIVLTGQDGKRVSEIPVQLERLYEMNTETLPPIVFVSFTANDFCDMGVLSEPVDARAERFRQSLAKAWTRAEAFLKPHPLGTRFVVLAPFEVANVLTNENILAQEVPLGVYGTVTCREMRTGEIAQGPIASFVAQRLIQMCPSVLGTRPDDGPRIARLRAIQDAFNQVWKAQVDALNTAHHGRGISWTYLEDVRTLDFATGDVANDCFHPGDGGHQKVADLVLRHLRTDAYVRTSAAPRGRTTEFLFTRLKPKSFC